MNKNKRNSLIVTGFFIVIAIIGLILVKKYNPEEESFFIPCVFNKLTGLKCAGCGMTRAMHYLVNGRLDKAIWYNLMIIPGAFVLVYSSYRYIKYIIKNEPIVNNTLNYTLKIFLAVIIIFMIARNFTTLFY